MANGSDASAEEFKVLLWWEIRKFSAYAKTAYEKIEGESKVPFEIDGNALEHVFCEKIHVLLEQFWPYTTPSIFKKAAAFTIAVADSDPIVPSFEKLSIAKIDGHQNVYLAFQFVRLMLHKAEIIGTRLPNNTLLDNKIEVSGHYLYDFIKTVATADRKIDYTLFNSVALIYESLAYQKNPTAQALRSISADTYGD